MWREQYRRIHRYRKKIENNKFIVRWYAIGYSKPDEEYFDDVYSCIQHLHHLKDWMISTGDITSNEANELIDKHPELKIIQDVCIGTKHLTTKFREQDFSITTKTRPAFQDSKASGGEREFYCTILYNNSDHDASELIGRVIDIWDRYLKSKNLLSS